MLRLCDVNKWRLKPVKAPCLSSNPAKEANEFCHSVASKFCFPISLLKYIIKYWIAAVVLTLKLLLSLLIFRNRAPEAGLSLHLHERRFMSYFNQAVYAVHQLSVLRLGILACEEVPLQAHSTARRRDLRLINTSFNSRRNTSCFDECDLKATSPRFAIVIPNANIWENAFRSFKNGFGVAPKNMSWLTTSHLRGIY